MKKKRLLINLMSNVISFVVQLGISFLLTPIIVEKVGDAAYGFIGLANNFASYASIFTVVINSMASRFITLELSKGNIEKANKYYSSVFFVDIIMSIMIAFASIVIIFNLNTILEIPTELNQDVKITFVLSAANLIISLMSTVYTIAPFAKNRLDISAIRNILGNIIKSVFLITVFSFFTPKIYYIPVSVTIVAVYLLIANIRITKKIAPELRCKKIAFDKECIKQLAKSGIWNSVNSLSKTLLTGLDLLISNIFVSPTAMGILSIAKTVPGSIEGLLGTISNSFLPNFIVLYSGNKIKELVKNVKYSLKIIGFIMIVPIVGFVVFGSEFFTLWLPNKTMQEIQQIQMLSLLSLMPYFISVSNYSLFLLDTVTNKLKRPVIATLIISTLSTLITLVLLKTTTLGVYAVAGVSSVIWCLKVIFFNTINASINLRIKWYTFFEPFLLNLLCSLLIFIIFMLVKPYLVVNTWIKFILSIAFVGVFGYLISFFIIFRKDDRGYIYRLIKNKLTYKKV